MEKGNKLTESFYFGLFSFIEFFRMVYFGFIFFCFPASGSQRTFLSSSGFLRPLMILLLCFKQGYKGGVNEGCRMADYSKVICLQLSA